ncbi:hypothetical protein BDF22DRAFT_743938 [Syncephalis plumigaleata]|nr:hypothetical protein BDF22DRAFT_743938 [Syncephalis plumigaleata]
MAPEVGAKALFPNAMGAVIQEVYNVNRDKHRSIRITIENHHSTLRLSGARFHCYQSRCKDVPSHVIDAACSQTTYITSAEPNTACTGYLLYRILDCRPTPPQEMELFLLIIWEVPVIGPNRCLLEVLQASVGSHLLRRDGTIKELVKFRREHRLVSTTHVQCQGWRVSDKAFTAMATMTNTVDAKLELRITSVVEGSTNLLDSPEPIPSTGLMERNFNIDPLQSNSLLQNDSYCGMRKKASLTIQINNQSRQLYLRRARFHIRDGNAMDNAIDDVEPRQQCLIPLMAHRKLKGFLVYKMDDKPTGGDGNAIKSDTAAAYRDHGLFLVIAWCVHPRKGNRLWVDVVRARDDIFPGSDAYLGQFYDSYIRYLLSASTRPSTWMSSHGGCYQFTSFIDAGMHNIVLPLNICDVSSDLTRGEAPLFLPNLGIGVTMNSSLAEITDLFARKLHWKQQQLLLIIENTHNDLILTPIWPTENISRQIHQGRHEISSLNQSRLFWSNEGIRVYQLIQRHPKLAPLNIIYFLVVRARDTDISVGVMATWASAYNESSIDMDAIADYVRRVPNMNRLPMARHIQQDIRLNNDTLFQLTAFRNLTMPFTLTLTIGHASSHQIHNWPESRTWAIPGAGLWRPLQGHINMPIPPKLRITMINDHNNLKLGSAQVFSTGYHLAASPEVTYQPLSRSVYNFNALPANEERDVYLFHTLHNNPSTLGLWFTVQARGTLLGYRVRCQLDEAEVASLDIPLSTPLHNDTSLREPHSPRDTIASFQQADGSTLYVALYVGSSMNGERTELVVCWADQHEKVEACIIASNGRLRASTLGTSSSSDASS